MFVLVSDQKTIFNFHGKSGESYTLMLFTVHVRLVLPNFLTFSVCFFA